MSYIQRNQPDQPSPVYWRLLLWIRARYLLLCQAYLSHGKGCGHCDLTNYPCQQLCDNPQKIGIGAYIRIYTNCNCNKDLRIRFLERLSDVRKLQSKAVIRWQG